MSKNYDVPSLTEAIESLIDEHTLLHVLTAIELVCGEKAEHIRANWQDNLTARNWDKASDTIGKALRNVHSGL